MKPKLAASRFGTVSLPVVALALLVNTAWGQTFFVTNTSDSGPGSLRQAISDASAGGGGGTILFSNVTSTISLSSGDLVITNTMSIVGPGSTNLAIVQGSFPARRVFTISNDTVTVSISGLTISGGNPDDYPYKNYTQLCGAGIYNAGTLFLTDFAVIGNATRHNPLYLPTGKTGDGGGIYNTGTLTVSNCIISGNSTGPGNQPAVNYSASSGNGGGIYNAGVLTVNGSTISGNATGGGNDGAEAYPTGSAGSGGGIYNIGALTMSGCAISSNSCGNGGFSDFDNPGGSGGSGGGIYNGGTLTVSNCAIYANSAGSGGGGGEGYGYSPFFFNGAPGGSGGSGGGICGGGMLVNCTIYGNSTGSGGSGGPASCPFNCQPGNGGYGGNGGSGGGMTGGATLWNCTIASNFTAQGGQAGGGAGGGSAGVNGSPGSAGGLGGGSQLLNTIIASNSAAGSGPDVSGSFTSLGHNLIGTTDSSSSGFGPSDLLNVDPQLGPLANNGGPTPTCALLPGSPAIDAGDDAVLSAPYNLTTDQRGLPRKSGAHVDIGAYELQIPFAIVSAFIQGTDMNITWTACGGCTNVVQATNGDASGNYTDNFADITASQTILPGIGSQTTNYIDVGGATNVPARYYRVRFVP